MKITNIDGLLGLIVDILLIGILYVVVAWMVSVLGLPSIIILIAKVLFVLFAIIEIVTFVRGRTLLK